MPADQTHVAEERGVAGVIERTAAGAKEIAAGHTHGLVQPAGQLKGGAVDGWGHVEASPGERDAASGHEVDRGGALRGEIVRELERCDDRGLVTPGELEGVAGVVFMGVGAEHKVARHCGGIDDPVGILAEVGIEHDPGTGDLHQKTRMAEIGEFHPACRVAEAAAGVKPGARPWQGHEARQVLPEIDHPGLESSGLGALWL